MHYIKKLGCFKKHHRKVNINFKAIIIRGPHNDLIVLFCDNLPNE